MPKQLISSDLAPQALGTYSQAIRCGNSVYLSGQIPLEPTTSALVAGDVEIQINQVFTNLQAVAMAAGGSLADLVKITVFLTDIENFAVLNRVMAEYCPPPYPARTVVVVKALPKGAMVAIDAIMQLI